MRIIDLAKQKPIDIQQKEKGIKMENSRFKFRAWDKEQGVMRVPYFHEFEDINIQFDDDELVFMQYTGLHDKNGAEIYERDIITDGYGNNGEVRYILDHCQFLINMGEGIDLQEIGDWCEVIGNIYENPELLK